MTFNGEITEKLFLMQDEKYRDFSSALMPTVDKDRVIGVRVPDLRRYAKELYRKGEYRQFLSDLPHKYFEENNLHGFIIEQIKDFDVCIDELEKFLPYIDNWATCDGLSPAIFKNNTERLLPYVDKWLQSEKTYTLRYGICTLMRYYLDDNFSEEYHEKVMKIETDEYYVNMAIAWYFATALAKKWDKSVKMIEEYRLPLWVHNKTISKAVESYRLTKEQKDHLLAYRKK